MPDGKLCCHLLFSTPAKLWHPRVGGTPLRHSEGRAEASRAVIDSINANPVRRGLVARAEDWEWSSARWYAGLRPVKLETDRGMLVELARG
jgi:putative transposase